MYRIALPAGVLSLLFAVMPSVAQDTLGSCLPVIDEVHERHRSLNVDGITLSDGSIRVTIAEVDGTIVFESRFPVVKEDGKYIEWEYRGANPYSMSRRVDENTIRTVHGMTATAKDIVRAIRRGQVSGRKWTFKTDDNFGCDWPYEDLSCTSAGNCCDTHDACFDAFNCTALSWLGLESPICLACNVVLVACIANGTGSFGLPSICCADGTCGMSRQPPFFGYFSQTETQNIIDQETPMDGSGSGGGGWFGHTPWGTIIYTKGNCLMPNGVLLPCG